MRAHASRGSGPGPQSPRRPASPATAALTALGVLVAVLAVAVACGGSSGAPEQRALRVDGRTEGGETADVSHTPTTSPETTTTTRPATGSGETVTLAFAGDSSFQGLDAALATDPAGVLSGIAPLLSGADLAVVNLEAALGTGGTPAPKDFTFRVGPSALDALKAAGVDAASMANNHGLDFGPGLLPETLAIGRDRGMPLLGIGEDDVAAYAPLVVEVKGQRIGTIAASDVFDSSLRDLWTAGPGKPGLASAEEAHQERLAAAVRELRPGVDTLVVFLHYGVETRTCPDARQRELVDLLVAAGADVVVGGHAHRVQGAGFLGDRLVAYGLGNFVFQAHSPEGAASGVLEVSATGRRVDGFRWLPAVIRGGVPAPLSGPAADAALATMAERRTCAGLTDAPPPTPPTPLGQADPGGAHG